MSADEADSLVGKIARVLDEVRDDLCGFDAEEMSSAVLPIVAEEVRKAKAEALRELSAHISEVVDNAKPWQVFTEHVLHEAGACDYLDRAATEYETGASDEHR